MKLVVLGANGRTGRLVVREALAEGAMVTAVVRRKASRLAIRHERLNIVVGDVCDAKMLARAFAGQDAVISALGGRSPTKKAMSIYWKSADAIAEAARVVGLKRVVVTSSALLFRCEGRFDRILAALARNVVSSAACMEETLRRADLNVAFARCGFLTNTDEPRYRAERDRLPARGSSVSRLGLARFLVDAIGDAATGDQIHGVSRPI